MAEKDKIYKCEICGNVVSVLESGIGTLVCCGQDMTLLKEKTVAEEQGGEKHVPIMEIENNKVSVRVGSVPHPMEDKHHISLIQIVNKDEKVLAGKRLKPGEEPKAVFELENTEEIYAREYCNIHGLWRSE